MSCPNCVCVHCDALEPPPCAACGVDTTELDRPSDGGEWFCDDCLRAHAVWLTFRPQIPTDWQSLVPESARRAT